MVRKAILYVGNIESPFQRELYKFLKFYSKKYGLRLTNVKLKSGTRLYEKLAFYKTLLELSYTLNVKANVVFVEYLADNAFLTTMLNIRKIPIIIRCHRGELYEHWNRCKERVLISADKASLIICVSQAIRRRLIALIPWVKDKSIVVYNSVDPLKFKPLKTIRRKHNENLIIGSLGYLIPRKGFIELINIIKDLIAKGYKIKLKIGGQGPLFYTLRHIVKKFSLERNVFIEGYINDLVKWYNTLDLFILNSKSEGMPTVVLEAMSIGLPVIATDSGGTIEAIEKNWTYRFGDWERLKDLILKIYSMTPEERERIGMLNRKRVTEKFNIRKNSLKIMKILMSFVENQS